MSRLVNGKTFAGAILFAIVLISSWTVVDFRLKASQSEDRRKRYIELHETLAERYQKLVEIDDRERPLDKRLTPVLTKLIDWHKKRASELRQHGVFDFEAEILRDAEQSPFPNDKQMREMLGYDRRGAGLSSHSYGVSR